MSEGDEFSVDYILSKTRERRKALDAELVRQASLSPHNSKRSNTSEKSSANDKENQSKGSTLSPPNKRKEPSLYPSDTLAEMKRSYGQLESVSAEPIVRPPSPKEQLSAAAEARKARMAALASKIHEFEDDTPVVQHTATVPPPVEMRSTPPRKSVSTPHAARRLSSAEPHQFLPHSDGRSMGVRFASPVATMTMADESDVFANTTVNETTVNTTMNESTTNATVNSTMATNASAVTNDSTIDDSAVGGTPQQAMKFWQKQTANTAAPKPIAVVLTDSLRKNLANKPFLRGPVAAPINRAVDDGDEDSDDGAPYKVTVGMGRKKKTSPIKRVPWAKCAANSALVARKSPPGCGNSPGTVPMVKSVTTVTKTASISRSTVVHRRLPMHDTFATNARLPIASITSTSSADSRPMAPSISVPKTTKAPSKTSTPVREEPVVSSPGSASTIAYSPTVVSGDHGKAKPSRRESLLALQTKSSAMSSLRNRWELSSATGKNLDPSVNSEDLVTAAVDMVQGLNRQSANRSSTTLRPPTIVEASPAPRPPQPSVSTSQLRPAVLAQDTSYDSSECADEWTESPDEDRADSYIDRVFQNINEQSSTTGSVSTVTTSPPLVLEDDLETTPRTTTPDDYAPTVHRPLLHSVSFYRRQRQAGAPPATPTLRMAVATGVRESIIPKMNDVSLEAKKKTLNASVNIQTEHMQQASRAIALCRNKPEFHGSREEVDAQRALLLATERRRVLYNELDRVMQGREESNLPRGTLTITDITVPLKRDFINNNTCNKVTASTPQLLYYFICLIKHREDVYSTQMISSDEALSHKGNLHFKHYTQIKHLPHDFAIKLEVYSLRTRREVLAHNTKYRIATPKSSKGSVSSTLSKSKTISAVLGGGRHQSQSHSPASTTTVLDPSFQLVGEVDLNLSLIHKHKLRLNGVQFSSDIDGYVFVQLRCYADSAGEVSYSAFLNMYEEVGGLGSWTRYWCLLQHGAIKLWRYPDEQQDKEPLAAIDLSRSTYDKVRPLTQAQCAGRPNAFRLDVQSDQGESAGMFKVIVSTDSIGEYDEWTTAINETLNNLHMWNPQAKSA